MIHSPAVPLPPKHLLVVEDEPAIRDMLVFALGRGGFTVGAAETVQEARLKLAEGLPDLLLLDWMLPGGTSGVEFARELKGGATTRDLPIIMLTARAEEEDKVRGLTLGCDDYITKPFSVPELLARVRAVLRRAQPGGADERLSLGGIVLDAAGQRVTAEADGASIALGPTEYRLLHFFMTHAERVYTREQVLDRVWGQNVYVEERTVDVHIRRLRKALEPWGLDALVQTVRGTGYRFSARV